MKKIEVIKDLCIACGACVAIDDAHFEFNDEGLAIVLNNDNLESTSLKEAMDVCPTDAIKFTEGDDENCVCQDCESNPCECTIPDSRVTHDCSNCCNSCGDS